MILLVFSIIPQSVPITIFVLWTQQISGDDGYLGPFNFKVKRIGTDVPFLQKLALQLALSTPTIMMVTVCCFGCFSCASRMFRNYQIRNTTLNKIIWTLYLLVWTFCYVPCMCVAIVAFKIYHNYKVDKKEFHNWMLNDMRDQFSVLSKSWKSLQLAFECCGVDSYRDWANSFWWNSTYKDIPDSCCISVSKGCGTGALEDPSKLTNISKKGCFVFLLDLLNEHAKVETLNFQLFLCISFVTLVFLSIIMFLCARTRRSLPNIQRFQHEILEEEEEPIGNIEIEENDGDLDFDYNRDDNDFDEDDEVIQTREMENVVQRMSQEWKDNSEDDSRSETQLCIDD